MRVCISFSTNKFGLVTTIALILHRLLEEIGATSIAAKLSLIINSNNY